MRSQSRRIISWNWQQIQYQPHHNDFRRTKTVRKCYTLRRGIFFLTRVGVCIYFQYSIATRPVNRFHLVMKRTIKYNNILFISTTPDSTSSTTPRRGPEPHVMGSILFSDICGQKYVIWKKIMARRPPVGHQSETVKLNFRCCLWKNFNCGKYMTDKHRFFRKTNCTDKLLRPFF